jgi:isopentenyl phosphate kinase
MNDPLGDGDLTVLKLGGSLITHKDRALSINKTALEAVAKQLGKWRRSGSVEKLILVHGGGSFGHYYAKKYGLSTSSVKASAEAISKTTQAMLELHNKVRSALESKKVHVETILPSEILDDRKAALSELGRKRLIACFRNGLAPITFGYVNVNSDGVSIISGDLICEVLAKSLPIKRQIFAMDVDGIFRNARLEGSVIPRLFSPNQYSSSKGRFDVTGGVSAKVELGFRLADLGTAVYFVNGRSDERLLKLILGQKDIRSTAIVPPKN